jgi:hypothetical protein
VPEPKQIGALSAVLSIGSPGWRVAPTVEPSTRSFSPVMVSRFSKSSLAGGVMAGIGVKLRVNFKVPPIPW